MVVLVMVIRARRRYGEAVGQSPPGEVPPAAAALTGLDRDLPRPAGQTAAGRFDAGFLGGPQPGELSEPFGRRQSVEGGQAGGGAAAAHHRPADRDRRFDVDPDGPSDPDRGGGVLPGVG